MQINVNVKELTDKLNNICSILPGDDKHLSYVKFQTKDNVLQITSSNLEISNKATIENIAIEEQGSFSLHGKDLLRVIKLFTFETLSMELIGTNVKLTDAEGKVKVNISFNTLQDDVQEFKEIDKSNYSTFDASAFTQYVNRVLHNLAADDSRFVFNGLSYSQKENLLRIAASDGRRLGYIEKNNNGNDIAEILIPHKSIKEIIKITKENKESFIALVDQLLYVKSGCYEIYTKLIDGTAPDYLSVIPKNLKYEISLPKDILINAVKLAYETAEDPSRQIVFSITKNTFTVLSNKAGKTDTEIEIEKETDIEKEIRIGFRGQYLLDVFSIVQAENVTIKFNDPNQPVIFLDESEKDLINVIMPMKI